MFALLIFGGWSSIAHDPSGDAGGPIFLLLFMVISVVVAALLGLLWMMGVTFASLGLMRTSARCRWSRVAAVLHFMLLVVSVAIGAYLA